MYSDHLAVARGGTRHTKLRAMRLPSTFVLAERYIGTCVGDISQDRSLSPLNLFITDPSVQKVYHTLIQRTKQLLCLPFSQTNDVFSGDARTCTHS